MSNIDYTERNNAKDQARRWRRYIVAAASGVAVAGALTLATAPGAAADPFPQCGASDPADCPPGSAPDAPTPWQINHMPHPDVTDAPTFGYWMPPKVKLPYQPPVAPPCPRGMHWSFTMGDCESGGF
jgi:hypothetical protein